MTVLISIYDQNENGSICVGEFFALFNDVNAGTVEWPEEEEDVTPTPDEDDDVPTPDEDDEVTPTPDEQDIIDTFQMADMEEPYGELDTQEITLAWQGYCSTELNENCWDEDAESECCTRNMEAVVELFDANDDGTICIEEFTNFYNQVTDGTIVWPEEEEDDVVPDEDDEDDTPIPDEDDEVDPIPDEDDEDDTPTPDEDDEVDPIPDEDDEDDTPIPDEDDEVDPIPDEDDEVDPIPDEDDDVNPIPDEDDEDDTPTPDEDGTDDEDEIDNNDNAITNQEDFDNWAWTRDVPENDVLNCGFDIRNEWHNGYYLWAGQNCAIYDLWVRIYVPQDAWENRKIWETSDMDCLEEPACDGEECIVRFKITPANPRLGLAFDGQGEEVNFRFETERWAPCVEEMTE